MDKDFHIHPKDNVFVSLADTDTRKRGHKYALEDIAKGELIIKYGESIGSASEDMKRGDHIHVHNVVTTLSDVINYDYSPLAVTSIQEQLPHQSPNRSVNVYERFNGEIGIRNELWIIPTVGCVNGVANSIIDRFKEELLEKGLNYKTLPYLDSIQSFSHNYGCSQMGDDHNSTKATLQNIVKHPNAGGVLVLGLGCENNQVSTFMETLGHVDSSRIKSLITQDSFDEIEEGCKLLHQLLENMSSDQRIQKPIACLNIGLECGGSDGLSGVTANPLVGRFSDYLIHHGGTTVLTEVPEMFGAEQQLMNRCVNKDIFKKTVDMINRFKNYYKSHGQVIYENPSPGNKAGGITTLEDKSLGCTTKSGNSLVMDVLKHTDRLNTKGLNLLSAPGNDLIATTALGMSGCQLVLFTTGRGTPFGGFIPTLKIATNHDLALRKPNWIDFDAGRLVEGLSMDQLLEEFIELIITTANGTYSKQETNNYREIAIFKSGVTL